MYLQVPCKAIPASKPSPAFFAGKRLLAGMGPRVPL